MTPWRTHLIALPLLAATGLSAPTPIPKPEALTSESAVPAVDLEKAGANPKLAALAAANEAASWNNLKQIGIAFHKHFHWTTPLANITGKGGEPLLSWRVTLLPHLGQRKLYK